MTQEEYMGMTRVSEVTRVADLFERAQFTDQDVWEGDPQVFPIIGHFSTGLKEITRFTETPIKVVLPQTSGFNGIEFKVYQVDKSWKINKVVRIICKKFNIQDGSKYVLATMRDFFFNPDLTLSDYGLGSLFRSWQLKISTVEQKLLKEQQEQEQKKSRTEPKNKTSTSVPGGDKEKKISERKQKIKERRAKILDKKKGEEDGKKKSDKVDVNDDVKKSKSSNDVTDEGKKVKNESKKDKTLKEEKPRDPREHRRSISKKNAPDSTLDKSKDKKDEEESQEKKKKTDKKKLESSSKSIKFDVKEKSSDSVTSPRGESSLKSSKTDVKDKSHDSAGSPRSRSEKKDKMKSKKRMSVKPSTPKETPTSSPAPTMTRKEFQTLRAASFPVLFIIENYTEFDGLRVKCLNILPSMTIKKVISSMMERMGHFSKSGEYVLSNLQGKILHPLASLETYGLGRKMHKWELVIVKKNHKEIALLEKAPFAPRFSWIKTKEIHAHLELKEAKKIILALDSRLQSVENNELQEQLKAQEATLASLQREVKILKESEEKLKEVANFSEAERATLPSLSEEIQDLKKQIAELEDNYEEATLKYQETLTELEYEHVNKAVIVEKIANTHKNEVAKLTEYSTILFEKNEELVGELEELRDELFEHRQKMKALEREKESTLHEAIALEEEFYEMKRTHDNYRKDSEKEVENLQRLLKLANDQLEIYRNASRVPHPESSQPIQNGPIEQLIKVKETSAPPPPPPPPSMPLPNLNVEITNEPKKITRDTRSMLGDIEAARQVLKKTEHVSAAPKDDRGNLLKEIHGFTKRILKKVVVPKEKPKVMDDLTAALNKRFIAMTDLMDTIEDLSDSDFEGDVWNSGSDTDTSSYLDADFILVD